MRRPKAQRASTPRWMWAASADLETMPATSRSSITASSRRRVPCRPASSRIPLVAAAARAATPSWARWSLRKSARTIPGQSHRSRHHRGDDLQQQCWLCAVVGDGHRGRQGRCIRHRWHGGRDQRRHDRHLRRLLLAWHPRPIDRRRRRRRRQDGGWSLRHRCHRRLGRCIGRGGMVNVNNKVGADIWTKGLFSNAIIAQSIGGGVVTAAQQVVSWRSAARVASPAPAASRM